MKKTLIFTVGLMLLLFTVQHCSSEARLIPEQPLEPCCFQFFTHPIPRRLIDSITPIDRRCPQPGFVITTAKGKRVCVKEDARWVQRVYEELQLS